MDRYSEITNKNQREIVLLKGFPCIWGKCSFCDYIDDNSNLEEEMNKLNLKVLKNVTGKYGVLEVINSGSCFELPKDTLEKIKCIIKEKNIKKLFLESHWSYKNRLKEMREYFEIPVVFKIGPLIVEFNSLSLSNPLILIILGLSNSFSTPFLSYLMYSMFNFLHTFIVFSLTFFA